MKKLLMLGGSEHCGSVLDCVLAAGAYTDIGIVCSKPGKTVGGIASVGTYEDLPALFEAGWTEAYIAVGSVGYVAKRRALYDTLKGIGFHLATVIDPSAAVAEDAQIAEGAWIGKHAVVNIGCRIGTCAMINTGSIIEHGCTIGDFAHVSPGATLCGQVMVGNDTHVGAGSTVIQGVHIGSGVMIGAGSVVVRHIPDGVKAYGVPCRVVSAWSCT